jgi:hypothetical protein
VARIPQLWRWIVACAVASALGASMGYFSIAAGLPRLLADALLIGFFQSLALGPSVRRSSWIAVTFAALGLALVAGIVVVLVVGTVLGPLEQTNRDAYVAVVYGLAAVLGGLVASAIQSAVLSDRLRKAPWLVGNAIGAPFVLPALAISWFTPESMSVGLPLWLIGLAGGLGYGLASGLGLMRSVPRRSPSLAM